MKSWLQSKTIWFNLITIIVTVLGQITNVITLDKKALEIIGLIVLVGNTILRFLTTEAIGFAKKE